jgi:Secretion system C-terminal sorting domain
MTETKLTFGSSKCWRVITTGLLAILLTTSAYAQPSCIGEVHATLGNSCNREITPDELLTPGTAGAGFQTQILRGANNWQPALGLGNGVITPADIGRRLQVRVILPGNPNTSCWSWVTVEDKDNPLLECPAPVALSCLQSTAPSTIVGRVILGNGTDAGTYSDCSTSTVTYNDVVVERLCTSPFPAGVSPFNATQDALPTAAGSTVGADALALLADNLAANTAAGDPNTSIIKFILRQYRVTDRFGNFTICYQVIAVKRLDATMTIVLPIEATFSCNTPIADFSPDGISRRGGNAWSAYPILFIPKDAITPALVCPIPATGTVLLPDDMDALLAVYDTVRLKPGSSACGVGVSYVDEEIPLCVGSFKKIRRWRVLNWCGASVNTCPAGVVNNATNIILGDQLLKYLDLTPPTVTATYNNYTTNLTYLCTRDENGNPVPEFLADGVTQNPDALFKRDITATEETNRFTDYYVPYGRNGVATDIDLAHSTTPAPDATIYNITALANSNTCTGNVSITLRIKDTSCVTPGQQVTLVTADDNRLTATAVSYNAATGETVYRLSGNFPVSADPYNVKVTVTDACQHASAVQEFVITVEDNAKPQPVCHEYLQLALGSDGIVRLNAADLNRASRDNCSLQGNLTYLMRRMTNSNAAGTEQELNADECFAQWINFNCLDAASTHNSVNNTAAATTISVVMRVCDEAGNFNDCMVQVLVEDKIKPTCIAPRNMSITCNQFANLYDLSNYGLMNTFDNCGILRVDSTSVPDLNNCRQGTITRTWTVTDVAGNTSLPCRQVITIRGGSDFSVDFPDDIIASCGADVDDDETAKNAMLTNGRDKDGHIENNGCGVLAVEVTHTTPSATTDNSCYKIFRKYRVIDWCRYNPNNTNEQLSCYGRPVAGDIHRAGFPWSSATQGNNAAWENLHVGTGAGQTDRSGNKVRERKFRDADVYSFTHQPTTAAGITARIDSINAIYAAGIRNTSLLETNKDHWTFADGIICFTQTIKVIDNVRPTVTAVADDLEHCDYASASNCAAHYTATLQGADECQGGVSTEDLTYSWTLVRVDGLPLVPAVGATAAIMQYTGATSRIDIASLPYDIIYRVNWTVADRCGNSTGDEYQMRFRDCKKPSVVCLNVNAEIMPTSGNVGGGGQIEIWPREFVSSVDDNCTDRVTLRTKIRVRRAGTGTGYPVNGTSVIYDCTDYAATADHTAIVEVWVQDDAGNADFCLATVTLQNNMDACGPSGDRARINGGIQTESRANVENVTVKAMLNGTQLAGSMVTRTDGNFALAGLTTGVNYAVRGERTDNILNGVTTYDIALISRHILGAETLGSAYKIIAADINGDRDINTADMIAARRAVLHLTTTFPNNVPSWRFVNGTYRFRNERNPLGEDFPEVVNIANAPRGVNAANFVGIKVGDVSGNATANGLAGLDIRGAAGTLTLKTDDLNLVAGKTYTVQLKSDDFKVIGMQGTLNFAKGYADKIAVVGQLPNMTEGNFGVFDNAITTSWNGKAAVETDVLTLTFRAKQNGKLSEILTIGSNLTYAEGYDAAGDSYSVNLSFNNGKVSGKEFALYQSEPNPSNSTTKIGFNLPEAAKATLSIYDVTGKLLRTVEGNYNAGYNALMIEKSELNANGVMYYRLDSGNNTATKKMIIID